MTQIPERIAELDLSQPLAVLCHSGVRSARVADYLAAAGGAQVANIAGGIDAWAQSVDVTIPRY
jgi:rhodanese-related sulfurtransferase